MSFRINWYSQTMVKLTDSSNNVRMIENEKLALAYLKNPSMFSNVIPVNEKVLAYVESSGNLRKAPVPKLKESEREQLGQSAQAWFSNPNNLSNKDLMIKLFRLFTNLEDYVKSLSVKTGRKRVAAIKPKTEASGAKVGYFSSALGKPLVIKGKTYKSIEEACKAFNIPLEQFKADKAKGYTDLEALNLVTKRSESELAKQEGQINVDKILDRLDYNRGEY